LVRGLNCVVTSARPYNEVFTNVILVAIIASSIMLALETPTFPLDGTTAGDAFFAIDFFFTVVFTIEMVVQMLALSVLVGRCRLTPGQTRVDRVDCAWLQRLKLEYDEPRSTFAYIFNYNFNLRPYVMGYFRTTANTLDFVIVFTAWLSIIMTLAAGPAGNCSNPVVRVTLGTRL